MEQEFGIVQEIGETLRGPILEAVWELYNAAEKLKYENLRELALGELDNVIDELARVGAVLENSSAYLE